MSSQPIDLKNESSLPGDIPGAQRIQVSVSRGQVDYLGNIIYRQVKSLRSVTQLSLSMLVPRNDYLKPAILYLPGGGFTSAEHNKFIEMRMALAEAGFVVAAAEYSTIPQCFPAPLADAREAVSFLRTHAEEYGIDPERIGILGDSAGGWLAQLLGTTAQQHGLTDNLVTDYQVQAVVSLYGISDLLTIGEGFSSKVQQVHASPAATEALLINGPAFAHFPGAAVTESVSKAQQASPLAHVSGNEPPFLIMHGSADSLVSPQQSVRLYQALRTAGSPVDYLLVEGAEHGDLHWYQPQIIQQVCQWFERSLGRPKPAEQYHQPEADVNL